MTPKLSDFLHRVLATRRGCGSSDLPFTRDLRRAEIRLPRTEFLRLSLRQPPRPLRAAAPVCDQELRIQYGSIPSGRACASDHQRRCAPRSRSGRRGGPARRGSAQSSGRRVYVLAAFCSGPTRAIIRHPRSLVRRDCLRSACRKRPREIGASQASAATRITVRRADVQARRVIADQRSVRRTPSKLVMKSAPKIAEGV